jgi:hypothetical protein
MPDSILTGMSKKEVFAKAFFLIVLPLFVAYVVFSSPLPTHTCLLCVESAASPAVSSLTLFGPGNLADPNSPDAHHTVANPRLIARFVALSLRLHRYKPDVTDLKLATRHYRLNVNKSLDTCQVQLLRTKSGHELITSDDGDYYECSQLLTFADSLFQHPSATQ